MTAVPGLDLLNAAAHVMLRARVQALGGGVMA
jgi:hypothetical protein